MAAPEPGMDVSKLRKEIDPGGLPDRGSSVVSDKYDPETLEIDHVAEKKLIRKLDLHIVPMVMLLYLLVWLLPSLLLVPVVSYPSIDKLHSH
jgi:hypothetical protein